MTDMVNHPPHYNSGGVETIEGIKAALGEGFVAYCKGNAMKYIWRSDHKGNLRQDLEKAVWYLNKALQEIDK